MKLKPPTSRPGFTLIEFIIIVAVLAVLAGIYLPAILRPRRCTGCVPNCTNNLKQIGLAFRQWALDSNDKIPPQVSVTNGGTMEWVGQGPTYLHFLVMSNELNTPKVLFCPHESEATRQPAVTFIPMAGLGRGQIPLTNDNSLGYFVGVDARDDRPTMFLAGDHHLAVGGKKPGPGLLRLWTNSPVAWAEPSRARHQVGGNIAMADGSVQRLNDLQFRKALTATGLATNRLSMP